MTPSAALARILAPAASIEGGAIRVTDARAIASCMDGLARAAVFGSEPERHWARWAIWSSSAQATAITGPPRALISSRLLMTLS